MVFYDQSKEGLAMQESRLFKIVYHLLDKGRATAPELADKFEVSVRTIYRDIDALSSAGIPIYAEREEMAVSSYCRISFWTGRYYLKMKNWKF